MVNKLSIVIAVLLILVLAMAGLLFNDYITLGTPNSSETETETTEAETTSETTSPPTPTTTPPTTTTAAPTTTTTSPPTTTTGTTMDDWWDPSLTTTPTFATGVTAPTINTYATGVTAPWPWDFTE